MRVDLAQFEAVAFLLADLLAAESLQPGAAVPTGNTDAEHAPWGLFRCADDAGSESWLSVCVTDDDGLGARWSASPGERCPTSPRGAPRPVAWPTRRRSRPRWRPGSPSATPPRSRTRSRPPGWPPGWPSTLDSRSSIPAFAGRGYAVAVDQPGSGPILLEGPAFTGTRMGSPDCRPAPGLSQHTAQICHELLGIDEKAFDALLEAGTVDAAAEESSGG